jgi:hypothetical protein
MKVAGIDVSSFNVDVVLLDEDIDAATWHRFELDGPTPFARTRSLRANFPTRSFWEEHGVYLIGIEDPHSRANHTAKALGLVTGGIAALLPRDLTVLQLPTAEWKGEFAGSGSATKERIAQIARVLGFTPDNLNATDAYGIAQAARALNNRAIQRGAA